MNLDANISAAARDRTQKKIALSRGKETRRRQND
jgi:hypothetical protein